MSLLQSGSYEFTSARAAMASPLAKKLFAVEGITGQYLVASAISKKFTPIITYTKPHNTGEVMYCLLECLRLGGCGHIASAVEMAYLVQKQRMGRAAWWFFCFRHTLGLSKCSHDWPLKRSFSLISR